MNSSVQLAKRPITPLWIIALFISLTETVLGVAVIQTEGNIQVALTAFVVVFPLLIALAFFLILWNRPVVLYPPTDFPGTDVEVYGRATQRSGRDEEALYAGILEAIQSTFASEEIVSELTGTVTAEATGDPEDHIKGVLREKAEEALETIRKNSFLTIDSRPLLGKKEGTVSQIIYAPDLTVDELLSVVRYSIDPRPALPAYGKLWALQDEDTENVFKRIGPAWSGPKADTRTLEQVGIKAGMRLRVVYLSDDET